MASRTLKSSRKHQPTRRPVASLSVTSLLSSLTSTSNGSSGSNGSNSTVTQESISHGKHRTSKSGASRRSMTESKRASRKDSQHASSKRSGKPNVFSFMENGDNDEERDVVGDLPSDSESDSQSDDEEFEASGEEFMPPAPPPPISAEIPFAIPSMPSSIPARPLSIISLHSDSGISIRSTSPERASPISPREGATKSAAKRTSLATRRVMRRKSPSSGVSSTSSHRLPSHQLDGTPESFYPRVVGQPVTPVSDTKRGTSGGKRIELVSVSGRPKAALPSPKRRHGYDLLTSNLSATEGSGPKPLYRRFEALNNRLILSLQDEIVTMERDLENLDREIAEIETSQAQPSSYRRDFQMIAHPLYNQRLQLQTWLRAKMVEYNQIIVSYNSLARLPSALPQHVEEYKAFLEEHRNPIVASEIAFLNRVSELVVVRNEDSAIDKPNKATLEAGAAILMTVMAFKMVPNILGRIALAGVVVLILTWAGFLPADSGAEGGTWGQKTAAYMGAIFVLAVAVG